jgi:hypothetical protein
MGFADNFNDNSIDSARWTKATVETQNVLVTVLEQNARIEIAPLAATAGLNYNALRTVSTFNLTGGSVVVKVPQLAAGGNANTGLYVELDANNYYAFVTEAGTLYRKKRVAAVNNSDSVAYSAVNHLWWRIRHNPSDDTIKWDTSTNGASWTTLRSATREFAITAVKVEMVAGTYESTATPGTAFFDDFALANGGLPPWLLSGDD